jgi:RNA polymerase sigma factor (sigma-70 family)
MKQQPFSLGIEHKIFNNEVRKRRLERHLSQIKLASLLRCSEAVISNIENFRSYPRKELANKMAKFFETSVLTLFPNWLKLFKPKQTKIITEHFITSPLLETINPLLITDGNKQMEDIFDKELLKRGIESAMLSLTTREKTVLINRFGLKDNIPQTLEEIGNKFGVTRERIRSIEAKAIRKLKHPSRLRKLQTFI